MADKPTTFSNSPLYYVVKPAAGIIVDESGVQWAITHDGKILVNRVVDEVTGGVTKLVYADHKVWQLSSFGWYGKSAPGDTWAHSATGPVSPDNKAITNQAEGIVDKNGYVAQLTNDGRVVVDGAIDPVTLNVKELQYSGGKLWQKTSDNNWYSATMPTMAWTHSAEGPGSVAPPQPSTGHVALGIQAGDPWGGGGSEAIFREFYDQMNEEPTEFCTFLEETLAKWNDSANYSASGINKANEFYGSGKITVASVGIPMVELNSIWQNDFPKIARGDWDGHITSILDIYANHNLEIMVRPGWEMNGNWYRWSVTPENASQYADAFRRIANVCHAFTRKAVKVCWNPGYIPGGSTDFTTFYPGDEYVDYIGIDTYGAASGVPNDSPFATYNDNKHWCVDDAIKFSLAHNKPLCFPETGCGPADKDFPKNLADKITSTKARINLMSLWDQPTGVGSGGQWSQNPECGAAWKDCLRRVREHNAW
jgi:hypothetical protein